MLKTATKTESEKKTALNIAGIQDFFKKSGNFVLKSVKKMLERPSNASQKLDLFSDTIYNSSIYNYCKMEKHKRMEKTRREVNL